MIAYIARLHIEAYSHGVHAVQKLRRLRLRAAKGTPKSAIVALESKTFISIVGLLLLRVLSLRVYLLVYLYMLEC